MENIQGDTNRIDKLHKLIDKMEYKPVSVEYARQNGMDSSALASRMGAIKNQEVLGEYFAARKKAVESGMSLPNGHLPEGSIKIPEILDNNQLDANLLAYLQAREAYLTLKSREIQHKGQMGEVEEHEAMRIGIAIRVLTGENKDPDQARFLFEQVDKIKSDTDKNYALDPRMSGERQAVGSYLQKISENIRGRFTQKKVYFT